jgi:hypothetical protein
MMHGPQNECEVESVHTQQWYDCNKNWMCLLTKNYSTALSYMAIVKRVSLYYQYYMLSLASKLYGQIKFSEHMVSMFRQMHC